MGIFSDRKQIESYNFYNYNYFDTLSDSEKTIFEHNEHYSKFKVNLHELRQAFFESSFSNNLDLSWFIPNDEPNYKFRLPYHVSDHPDRWKTIDTDILDILQKKGILHVIKKKNTNIPKTVVEKEIYNYYINSHGFRSPELNQDPCIAFLGCSHTFGTGLDQKDIWVQRVSKELGVNPVNLGFPARGLDFVSFYCKYFFKAEIKNCKALVVLLPPLNRKTIIGGMYDHNEKDINSSISKEFLQMEWIEELTEKYLHIDEFDGSIGNGVTDNLLLLKNWENWTDVQPRKSSIKKHFAQDLHLVENRLRRGSDALAVIKNLSLELDIPLLVYSSYKDFTYGGFVKDSDGKQIFDMARDGQHAGTYTNKVFSEKVIKDLKQKIDK